MNAVDISYLELLHFMALTLDGQLIKKLECALPSRVNCIAKAVSYVTNVFHYIY